jgi:hypothetical protein
LHPGGAALTPVHVVVSLVLPATATTVALPPG